MSSRGQKKNGNELFQAPSAEMVDVLLSPFWLSEGYGKGLHVLAHAYYDLCRKCFVSFSRKINTGEGFWAEAEIFPALSLYRHSVELCIKAIIVYAYSITSGNIPKGELEKISNNHKLLDLFCKVETIVPVGANISLSVKARRILVQLDSIDASGQTFRYPFDNKQFEVTIKPGVEISSQYLWLKLQKLGDELFGNLEGLINWHEENLSNNATSC
jgi:hypothetical protein